MDLDARINIFMKLWRFGKNEFNSTVVNIILCFAILILKFIINLYLRYAKYKKDKKYDNFRDSCVKFFEKHGKCVRSIQYRLARFLIKGDTFKLENDGIISLAKLGILIPNSLLKGIDISITNLTNDFKDFSNQTESRILFESVIDDCTKHCYVSYKNVFIEMKKNSDPSSYSKLLYISLHIIGKKGKKEDLVFLNYKESLLFVEKDILSKSLFEGQYITEEHFTQTYLDYCELEETKLFLLEQIECYVADIFPKLKLIERRFICFMHNFIRNNYDVIHSLSLRSGHSYIINVSEDKFGIFNNIGISMLKSLKRLGFVMEYPHTTMISSLGVLMPILPQTVFDYITNLENYDLCLKYWDENCGNIELPKQFLSPSFLCACGL